MANLSLRSPASIASVRACPVGGGLRIEFAEDPKKAFHGNRTRHKGNESASEQNRIASQPYHNYDRRAKGKENTGVIFKIIQDALSEDPSLSIRRACQLHGISRSGYYKWKKRPEPTSSETVLDTDLKDQLREIAQKFPEYGYRRVTKKLKEQGYVVNHKRVLRIMRECAFG